jgi:pimeloyl-ACP methyl ester carboxylesterase
MLHMNNEPKYPNKILVAAIIVLLAILGLISVLLFPPYEPLAITGPYSVGTVRYHYTDESRIEKFGTNHENRQISVSFWFPERVDDTATYPLIVFSHGGLGLETSNESLYLELASHGYVVCSIGHPYHAFWIKGEDGRITFVSMDYFRELQQEDAKSDKEQSYRYYQSWMATRTADINFAIDTILANAVDGADGVYALVDRTRLGLIGHSLGGSAALAIPRQRDDIAAVIALESPFLYDIVGVENGEFRLIDQAYPVPVMNIYTDSSWDHLAEWPQYARNYALLSDDSGIAFNLHIPGAGHFSLTDLALSSPLLVRLLEGEQSTRDGAAYLQDVNRACLEYFNLYLKANKTEKIK